ncbi:uncharacterized protein G2W53_025532 [Senna tora]|uniref:Uncharacterized protein n=1 Tax=Senna tora TaxID=362788 RepID=A0A834TDC8_9FABA|nr:uncharacterized protein G2W53_025532 [Senna tora]
MRVPDKGIFSDHVHVCPFRSFVLTHATLSPSPTRISCFPRSNDRVLSKRQYIQIHS